MRVKSALLLFLLFISFGLSGCGAGSTSTPAANAAALHSVTYNGNGNDGGYAPIDSNSYKEGDYAMVLANTGGLVKNGYIFSGWNTQANGGGTTYQPFAYIPIGQSDIVLYAKWTLLPTYTVTYNVNGGSGSVPDSNNYQQGQIVTVAGNPNGMTKSGYTFVGWNTTASGIGGTPYSQWQTFPMGGSNTTLYAQWTTSTAYNVTYNANGTVSSGSVPVSTQEYLPGQAVYVPGNTGNLVNASGYTYVGWNTQSDGTGTTYNQGESFPMPVGGEPLYADWTNQQTYKVTYYGNNNDGGSVPIDTGSYIPGGTATVLGNTGSLVKTGYVFFGWNTQPDGSGTTYEEGEQFTISSPGQTLYALWAVAGDPGPVQVITAIGPNVTTLQPARQSRSAVQQGVTRTVPLGRMRFASMSTARPDRALQSVAGSPLSATLGFNFDGISNVSASAADGMIMAPPDTNGAVGATQYVQWVNSAFQVFDKTTGNPVSPVIAGNTLWRGTNTPCATNNDGDIIAQYDKAANRWIMQQPVFWLSNNGVPPSGQSYYMCVAVSQTSDATGSYYQYEFPVSSSVFPDYPKLGIWPDGYYLSVNQFDKIGDFMGPEACVMDRASMLGGKSAKMQCFTGLGPNYGSLLPSDADGATPPPAGAPDYFISLDSSNFNSLDLWQFHADFTNPANTTLTGPVRIPVDPYSLPCTDGVTPCIPQSGTTNTLDSLGDRLMYRFAYRNMVNSGNAFINGEAFVVNHSVDTGSTVGVRWYQLTIPGPTPASCIAGLTCGVPSLNQQGTFAPDGNDRWMGSIAMDNAGDIAMGYSESGLSMYPSIYYTGWQPGVDSAGQMESEAPIVIGGGAQTNPYRWGDYSSISVDPSDNCTFWYTNEYYQATGDFNWNTRIASFKFPGCQ